MRSTLRFAPLLPVLGVLVFAFAPGASAPAASRHSPGRAAPITNRYALVHGCYTVRQASGQVISPSDGPFRMQAAALGQYLLYGVHRDYLGPSLVPVSTPGPSTVWQVSGDSRSGFHMTNLATGTAPAVSARSSSDRASSRGWVAGPRRGRGSSTGCGAAGSPTSRSSRAPPPGSTELGGPRP
jgi:hypothetical protein